jgi:hypothetical protein
MSFIKLLIAAFLLFSCVNQRNTKNNGSNKNQQESHHNQSQNIQIIDQEKQYVLGTEDIPLFDGLELIEDEGSDFDTMTGNIIITNYSSQSSEESIKFFYHNTLPQLGWQLSKSTYKKMSFIREKDRLEISIKSINKNSFISFFILNQI